MPAKFASIALSAAVIPLCTSLFSKVYTSKNCKLAVDCKNERTLSLSVIPANSILIIPLAASGLILGEANPNLSIRVLNIL